MSGADLTVALTAHAETVMAGPTVHSAEAAILKAEEAGFSVERLIGFDAPTPGCKLYFEQPIFDRWRKLIFEFRDQGQTRNALAEAAEGRWIAFLDGDDLFSENWLVEAAMLLSRSPNAARQIVHPELNIVFDAGQFVFTKPAQNDPIFTPYYFASNNYYDALAVAPREAYLSNKFPDRAVKHGFAFEDWQWAMETMAAGWLHVVAKDTIIFKRRRDSSQTHESRDNSVRIRAISALHVDNLHRLGLSEHGQSQ